jgi:hypothetical protein
MGFVCQRKVGEPEVVILDHQSTSNALAGMGRNGFGVAVGATASTVEQAGKQLKRSSPSGGFGLWSEKQSGVRYRGVKPHSVEAVFIFMYSLGQRQSPGI